MSRMLSGAPVAALALVALFAGRSDAQYVVVAPYRPVVRYYYAPPAPVVTYAAPRVSYYVPAAPVYVSPAPVYVSPAPVVVAPTTTVTTYYPYRILPRRRVSVTTYYTAPAAVSYGPIYYR